MDKTCRATVVNYHYLVEFLMNCAATNDPAFPCYVEAGATHRVRDSILPWLRNSKIFSVPPDVATQVWNVVDKFVLESTDVSINVLSAVNKFAGESQFLGFASFMDVLEHNRYRPYSDKDLYEPYGQYVSDEGNFPAFPNKLPFDDVYLGYGEGIELSGYQSYLRSSFMQDAAGNMGTMSDASGLEYVLTTKDVLASKLLGHYISTKGVVVEYYVMDTPVGKVYGYTASRSGKVDGSLGWEIPGTLMPWFIPTMIDLINENNKTFTFQGSYDKKTRRELGRKHKKFVKRKKGRPVLPAYYVIDIAPKIVRKRAKNVLRSHSNPGSPLTHRHDRDGHERVLVRRGELPLDNDERQLLTLRGYDVYTESQPSDENKRRLVRRRLPLRHEGEWLAVRTSWVNSTVVGDESLPYKPALRRLTANSIVDLLRSNTEGGPPGV